MRPYSILCIFVSLLATAVAGCGQRTSDPAAESVGADISIERYREDVAVLSSDEFGGRAPSSEGERKTVQYLIDEFKKAGAIGGNDGEFTQAVPLVAITATEVSPLRIESGQGAIELEPGRQTVTWTKQVVESVSVDASPMVFVGYGIVAPEYDWNDYEGVDVAGKTVVMLVNDPGFATGDDDLFTGRRMTYYGRWTYKFEEAARQGATGAILVHETEAAGYPWLVVAGGWTGPQFDLERENGNADRAVFEGWVSRSSASEIFNAAGMDFAASAEAATQRGFTAREMGTTATVSISNSLERSNSQNVVALLPGDQAPDEYVAFSAHWDHLGVVDNGNEDGVFNGAVDNATGTAALLELARVMGASEHRRSLLFVVVTAEESGLLGSAWFAQNPTVPLERTAGLVNIDAMSIIGPTRDVTMIGYGSSTLQDYLAAAAAEQDRTVEDEPTPEKGFFYRSDHFNFAKAGVPVLYAKGGVDHVVHGREYGEAALAEHISNRYHRPADEIHEGWDFAGLLLDLQLYRLVAEQLANNSDWPVWSEQSEFRGIREASAADRQ
ncbi:MAG: M28 family metallopeptidase [Pseudomonadota bacterium]